MKQNEKIELEKYLSSLKINYDETLREIGVTKNSVARGEVTTEMIIKKVDGMKQLQQLGLEIKDSRIKLFPKQIQNDVTHSWLVEGLIDKNTINILCGSTNVGKTWIGLSLAISLATNTKFANRAVNNDRDVVYISNEGNNNIKNREKFIFEGLKINEYPLNFSLMMYQVPLNNVQNLIELVQLFENNKINPSVIFIDNLATVIDGRNTDTNLITELFNNLHALITKYDCTIVMLHHKIKSGITFQGAQTIEDLSDNFFNLNRRKNGIELSVQKSRDTLPEYNNTFIFNFERTTSGSYLAFTNTNVDSLESKVERFFKERDYKEASAKELISHFNVSQMQVLLNKLPTNFLTKNGVSKGVTYSLTEV